VTGEATPYYLCHPRVPRLVAEELPDVKLIALLRDPADRAFSQYQMVRDEYGLEPLGFEEALAAEEERLDGELERLEREPGYVSVPHLFHGYKERGMYAAQLERWFACFDASRVLVLLSEELFADPPGQFDRVTAFLGLPPWQPAEFRPHNERRYAPMRAETRRALASFFAPHNARLAELLGIPQPWPDGGAAPASA
jgi:hypothetical protein